MSTGYTVRMRLLDQLAQWMNRVTGNRAFVWFRWCRYGRAPLTAAQIKHGQSIARKHGLEVHP